MVCCSCSQDFCSSWRPLPHDLLIQGSKHVAATVLRATGTGVFRGIRPVAVIVGKLFTCTYIPQRDNPQGAGRLLYCAVGITGMVDVACPVHKRFPVNITVIIERKDIHIPPPQPSLTLLFGNLLARVPDDPSPLPDSLGGKESPSRNSGFPNPQHRLHRIPAFPLDMGDQTDDLTVLPLPLTPGCISGKPCPCTGKGLLLTPFCHSQGGMSPGAWHGMYDVGCRCQMATRCSFCARAYTGVFEARNVPSCEAGRKVFVRGRTQGRSLRPAW